MRPRNLGRRPREGVRGLADRQDEAIRVRRASRAPAASTGFRSCRASQVRVLAGTAGQNRAQVEIGVSRDGARPVGDEADASLPEVVVRARIKAIVALPWRR
jgi:hypothetical protein